MNGWAGSGMEVNSTVIFLEASDRIVRRPGATLTRAKPGTEWQMLRDGRGVTKNNILPASEPDITRTTTVRPSPHNTHRVHLSEVENVNVQVSSEPVQLASRRHPKAVLILP